MRCQDCGMDIHKQCLPIGMQLECFPNKQFVKKGEFMMKQSVLYSLIARHGVYLLTARVCGPGVNMRVAFINNTYAYAVCMCRHSLMLLHRILYIMATVPWPAPSVCLRPRCLLSIYLCMAYNYVYFHAQEAKTIIILYIFCVMIALKYSLLDSVCSSVFMGHIH